MSLRIKGLLIGGFWASFCGFLVFYLCFSGRLHVWLGESTLSKLISDGAFLFLSLAMIIFFVQGLWQLISGKDVFAYLFEDKSKGVGKNEESSGGEN